MKPKRVKKSVEIASGINPDYDYIEDLSDIIPLYNEYDEDDD